MGERGRDCGDGDARVFFFLLFFLPDGVVFDGGGLMEVNARGW